MDSAPPSRICVKSLPKHVTDKELREHFSQRGEVTDAKVMKSKDGQSRQFGFVGFKSAAQAEDAIKYFNKTFLGASRINVEFAQQRGSETLPRPWSKHTEGRLKPTEQQPGVGSASGDKKAKKKGAGKGLLDEAAAQDPKLAEFLQVMVPRNKGSIWSNDDVVAAAALPAARQGTKKAQVPLEEAESGSDGEDDSLYQELLHTTGRGVLAPGKLAPSLTVSDDEEPEVDEVVMDEGISDLEYMRQRMRGAFDEEADVADEGAESPSEANDMDASEEDEGVQGDEAAQASVDSEEEDPAEVALKERATTHSRASTRNGTAPAPESDERSAEDSDSEGESSEGDRSRQKQPGTVVEADEAVPPIKETGRLFLRNLPYTASEAELAELFGSYGELSEVHVVLDRATRMSKGLAYVQFLDPQDAVAAHSALDGNTFQGRLLHILPARQPPSAPADGNGNPKEEEGAEGGDKRGGAAGFKGQRDAERKSTVGNRAAWNTLFMRPDTVAEAVAAHYRLPKAQLLDPAAPDMAVRLALGETHVIALTKAALGDAGVSVEALEEAASASGKASATKSVARSPTALLVKNLPYAASEAELRELFGGWGALARLVLPPTKTLAVVEFAEATDARRAFKGLAYKRFHHVPIYLEWAPRGVFRPDAPLSAAAAPARAVAPGDEEGGAVAPGASVVVAGLADAEADDESAESTTLFVKNLAWSTTDAVLAKHFDAAVSAAGGNLRSARVARRPGPDGKPLSAGFGFVECSSEAVAKIALKTLQGSMLDGHKLVLQLSMRRPGASTQAGENGTKKKKKGGEEWDSSKLVVRNVAFEATRKDILALFGPFGQVKSCRLPRKFDGSHRGFAFVDFLTKREARNAAEAVGGTHLYGRRLVVEPAADAEGLDELRAKTAAQFRGDEDAAAAPSRKRAKLATADD